MKYYFNSLRKMGLENLRISQATQLIRFHYTTGRIEKKEYRYLVKQLFKIKNIKRRNF